MNGVAGQSDPATLFGFLALGQESLRGLQVRDGLLHGTDLQEQALRRLRLAVLGADDVAVGLHVPTPLPLGDLHRAVLRGDLQLQDSPQLADLLLVQALRGETLGRDGLNQLLHRLHRFSYDSWILNCIINL